jgi:hypothetical protein
LPYSVVLAVGKVKVTDATRVRVVRADPTIDGRLTERVKTFEEAQNDERRLALASPLRAVAARTRRHVGAAKETHGLQVGRATRRAVVLAGDPLQAVPKLEDGGG